MSFAKYTVGHYLKAVLTMRDAQRYYFKEKSAPALAAAMKAERLVDRLAVQVQRVLDDSRYWEAGAANAVEYLEAVEASIGFDVVDGG
jgi:hypothetical protein